MRLQAGKEPFPWWVLDEFFDLNVCKAAADEFPSIIDPRWQWFQNDRELKAQSTTVEMWGPNCRTLIEYLMAPHWIEQLEAWTGIPRLIPNTLGGGLHMVPPGGHLGIHADFNRSQIGLYRRVNCLLYLNEHWQPEWGGALELHGEDGDPVVIQPVLGRCAMFLTSSTSFHGHPHPTQAPVARRSIAVYYYTHEAPEGVHAPHSTIFKD